MYHRRCCVRNRNKHYQLYRIIMMLIILWKRFIRSVESITIFVSLNTYICLTFWDNNHFKCNNNFYVSKIWDYCCFLNLKVQYFVFLDLKGDYDHNVTVMIKTKQLKTKTKQKQHVATSNEDTTVIVKLVLFSWSNCCPDFRYSWLLKIDLLFKGKTQNHGNIGNHSIKGSQLDAFSP